MNFSNYRNVRQGRVVPSQSMRLDGAVRFYVCALAVFIASAGAAESHGAAANWKPAKPVELIAAVSAGSAHDDTIRVIQNILRERRLVTAPTVIVNKPGGGQTLAMSYLSRYGEDGYSLLLASVPQLTAKIAGTSALTYSDFTPVTQLFNEYVAFAVRKDSALTSGADMINQLRKSPRALSIAIGSALGNGPHLALSLAMKEGGVMIRDMKTVVFSGGSEATTAVLGGHVDVLATTTGNVLPFVMHGDMRVIAVSSPRRLGGAYAQVPTWKEQGINSVFSSFRAMLGTKGMDAAQVAYWEQAFIKLTQSEEWKQYLEKNNLATATLGSRECEAFLKGEYARLQAVMTELGLAK